MTEKKKRGIIVNCEHLDLLGNPELKMYQEKTSQKIVVIKFKTKDINLIKDRFSQSSKSIVCIEADEKKREFNVEHHTRGLEKFFCKIEENENDSTFYAIFCLLDRLGAEFFERTYYWLIDDIMESPNLKLKSELNEEELKRVANKKKDRTQKNHPYFYHRIKKILELDGLKIEGYERDFEEEAPKEFTFKDAYKILYGTEKYAQVKINEDLSFTLIPGSILKTPKVSKELKEKVKDLREKKVLEYKHDKISLLSQSGFDSPSNLLSVLKEYSEDNLKDIVKLVIGKERLHDDPWDYLEDGFYIKREYEKLYSSMKKQEEAPV